MALSGAGWRLLLLHSGAPAALLQQRLVVALSSLSAAAAPLPPPSWSSGVACRCSSSTSSSSSSSRSSSSFAANFSSSSSAAAAAAAAATSGSKKRQKEAAAGAGARPPDKLAPQQQQEHAQQQQEQEEQEQQQLLAALKAAHRAPRLRQLYDAAVAHELALKLDVGGAADLPRLRHVDLAISAKDAAGRRYAEKWEMLLPALALEVITGRPAEFVASRVKYYRSRNAITAVKVRLRGGEAYDLLQKLVYAVLPSQSGFAGVPARSFDRGGNLHFRVPKPANFPDFEEQFELFEGLGALHVSIAVSNAAKRPERAALLLSGLQLPILQPRKAGGGGGEDAAAEEAAAAVEAWSESDGSESDGSESESDG